MLNNTLTAENAEEVADQLVDALTYDADDVDGFETVDIHRGEVDGEWWAVALVHDLGRDRWLSVSRDWNSSSVMEWSTRTEAEADIAEGVATYAETVD